MFGHAATVDRNKRPCAARHFMQISCNDFLARSCFAIDQDMGIGAGDIANQGAELFHRRIAADKVRGIFGMTGQFDFQCAVFKHERAVAHCATGNVDKQIRRIGLFDKIKRPVMHRLNRGGDIAMPGHQYNRHFRIVFFDFGKQFKAVHFRHANVGDNDARPAVLDAFKRSSSSPEDFDMDIGKLERLLCGFSHIFIVINKQDAFCGCRH